MKDKLKLNKDEWKLIAEAAFEWGLILKTFHNKEAQRDGRKLDKIASKIREILEKGEDA